MAEPGVSGRRIMTNDADGDATSEVPLRFPAGGEDLFGILTKPGENPRGIGVIYFGGMWDRNRFSIKLSRRLANSGFHALRFDYRGVGESTGRRSFWMLDRPATHDLLGAVDEMHRQGVEQLILVGRCFGARTVLSAVGKVQGLQGIAFLSMPLHDKEGERPASRWAVDQAQEFLRLGVRPRVLLGVFNRRRRRRYRDLLRHSLRLVWQRVRPQSGNGQSENLDWLSGGLLESLRGAVNRRLPLLFLYGSREDHYWDFQRARSGELGTLLAQAGDRVRVSSLDGPVHNLTSIQTQEEVLSRIQEWAESLTSTQGPPAGTRSLGANERVPGQQAH